MGAALCSMTTRVCSDVPLGLGNAFSILYLDETKRDMQPKLVGRRRILV